VGCVNGAARANPACARAGVRERVAGATIGTELEMKKTRQLVPERIEGRRIPRSLICSYKEWDGRLDGIRPGGSRGRALWRRGSGEDGWEEWWSSTAWSSGRRRR
jgi:hypothetical protein